MAVRGTAACARESSAITVETSLRDAMSHSFRQRHAPHMPPPRQHADKQNTEQNDWLLHQMQNKYRINLLLSDINYMYSLKNIVDANREVERGGNCFSINKKLFLSLCESSGGGWQSEATSS
jgi:hypothetical protein